MLIYLTLAIPFVVNQTEKMPRLGRVAADTAKNTTHLLAVVETEMPKLEPYCTVRVHVPRKYILEP